MFQAQDLIDIFNELFRESLSSELVGGGVEPVYLPANQAGAYHRIVFTRDYYASALHEISHWCIAGEVRRQQIDYGYWYEPDGRTVEQQQSFELVEIKPQALEWIFSVATGVKFRVSADNLTGGEVDISNFFDSIESQVGFYFAHGLPDRAEQFCRALLVFYDTGLAFDQFRRELLEETRLWAEEPRVQTGYSVGLVNL